MHARRCQSDQLGRSRSRRHEETLQLPQGSRMSPSHTGSGAGYMKRNSDRKCLPKTFRPLRATGVIAALVACIATAGCGGATSTTAAITRTQGATATSPTTTKAEFIATGDAICRSSDAAIKPLKQQIKDLEGQSNASVTMNLPPILR